MNILLKNKNYIIKIILYLTWISLILSINTNPAEIQFFGQSIVKSFNAIRIIIPLTITFIVIIYFFYLILKKKILLSEYSSFFYLWFVYFFLQIVGGIVNDGGSVNEINIYYSDWSYQRHIHLPILGICTILVLLLTHNQKIELKYFLNILVGILALISLTLLSIFLIKKGIKNSNLYYLIDQDFRNTIINQPTPRITGLSRMLAIANLFAISLFLFRSLDKSRKIFLFLGITVLSIIITASQSRGTFLCFFLTTIYVIFFLKNNNLKQKINLTIILILLPIFTYNILNITSSNKFLLESDDENQQKKLDFSNKNRYLSQNDSGRIILWKKVLNRYEHKNLFGYGPQTDRRFLLENVSSANGNFGNNVSNGFIYAFLCGGYFALLCYLIINYKIANNIVKNISIVKNLNNTDIIFYYKLSSVYLLFFFIRQIFENSFSLFSIDFLIVIICMFIINKNNHNFKKT
jgi:O-antigen ligase